MTKYDPAIIQKLADKLYQQANTVVFVWTFIGLAAGGGGGYVLGAAQVGRGFSITGGAHDVQMCAIMGAVVVGLIGFAIGMSRSFMLRVQAQMALCQRQIELNTRRP